MISAQLLQSTLDGLKEISGYGFAVFDVPGRQLAATEKNVPLKQPDIVSFAESSAESRQIDGYQLFRVKKEQRTEYVLSVTDGSEAYTLGRIAAFQITGLLGAYREQYDKDSFIKNLLLDNLLLVDIYSRARILGIGAEEKRCVFLVGAKEEGETILPEEIRDITIIGSEDFVTSVDDKNVVVVKAFSGEAGSGEIRSFAESLAEAVKEKKKTELRVSYGTVVGDLKEVSRSYKEARMALDVGKIFLPDLRIAAYSRLGIGRLIYQLPLPLCRMFISEIFHGRSPDDFDEETLTTIDKFFENSLNVSETSRQLFIHRNTLVYRLDKIEKTTGLDLRVFEDAITFKIVLMVAKYMKYMEQFEY